MSTIRLKVHNHSIALPADLPLADGTEVQVVVPEEAGDGITLYDSLRDFVGVIKDGPSDLAAEHDHYAHGTPKRSKP